MVGIAAAAIWKVPVVLTDLPEIQGNLFHNVRQNAAIINEMGGSAISAVLDWKHTEGALADLGSQAFEVCL